MPAWFYTLDLNGLALTAGFVVFAAVLFWLDRHVDERRDAYRRNHVSRRRR